MAASFTTGSSATLAGMPAIGSGSGATGALSFRMRTVQSTVNAVVLSRASASSSALGITMFINNTAGKISAYAKYNSANEAFWIQSATTINDNTWHTVGVNFSIASGAANELFVDGVSQGTQNSIAAWYFSDNNLILGNSNDGFWPDYIGDLAEVGWWNAHLTAEDHAALAKDFRPSHVRPANLTNYIPAVRSVIGLRSSALTIGGTVVAANHPPVR